MASEHGLNIMSDTAREYTRARLAALKPLSGVAFADRLWRNLLSSQPLAFSIAGELRRHEDAAAGLLSELTGYEVRALETLCSPDYPGHALDGVEAE